jgi:hypothetical protein
MRLEPQNRPFPDARYASNVSTSRMLLIEGKCSTHHVQVGASNFERRSQIIDELRVRKLLTL